ncbi:MAG: GNAT family N-acetyltransferase [Steroidobacter sp.]
MPSSPQFTPVHTDAQISTVAELAWEIWNEFYVPIIGQMQVDYMVSKFQSAAAITTQIRDGYEYFLVQRQNHHLGYCAVLVKPQEGALFISKFYLHGGARGSGTGRICMEFIEQLARQRGLTLLWLTVNKGNPSVNAYQRLGFCVAAELVMDIGEGFVMDDFRMEKRLA